MSDFELWPCLMYLDVMKDIHDLLNDLVIDEKWKIFKVDREYHKISTDRWSIIEEITKIEREEENARFIFDNADFSTQTIQKLIKQCKTDAEEALQNKENKKRQNKTKTST